MYTLFISGTENEGYFDPWSLLNAFKRKAVSLGVDYISGEVVDFVRDQNGQICSVKVWYILLLWPLFCPGARPMHIPTTKPPLVICAATLLMQPMATL